MEENKGSLTQETAAAADTAAAETTVETAAVQEKKTVPAEELSMRRTVNHTFKWIVIYNVFYLAVASLLGPLFKDLGLQSIVSTLLGAGLVFLCTSKRWGVNPFKGNGKKMTVRDFFTILGIFMISQFISLGTSAITDAMGLQGTSIDMSTMTVPLIIYASITGPFVEELMYRGFAAGTMKRKGLIPAIVLSSMAFGLMHGNLSQFVIGMVSGLVLGYVYSEYSLWWAFLIHLINNSTSTVISFVPEVSQNTVGIIVYSVFGALAVFGIVEAIIHRAEVKEWFARPENHMQKGDMKGIFSSAWMYIFIIIYLSITVFQMVLPGLKSMMNVVR